MLKVKVVTIGKTKEAWLNEAVMGYEKRLKGHLIFDWVFVKDNDQLSNAVHQKKFIALDPNGSCVNSLAFSKQLFSLFIQFHSEITFVIGGAEGIPQSLLIKADKILSLSKLTFTHQITRLVLVEQIYRAYQIEYGSKSYHK